jgi:hypothetical protein
VWCLVFYYSRAPLAFPIFSLSRSAVATQTRSDIYKLVKAHRRPARVDTANVGVWQGVIETISVLACITNFAFLATHVFRSHDFTTARVSSSLPLVDWLALSFGAGTGAALPWLELLVKLALLVLAEHVVLGLKTVLAAMIPDVPHEVEQALRRDEHRREQLILQKGGARPARA